MDRIRMLLIILYLAMTICALVAALWLWEKQNDQALICLIFGAVSAYLFGSKIRQRIKNREAS